MFENILFLRFLYWFVPSASSLSWWNNKIQEFIFYETKCKRPYNLSTWSGLSKTNLMGSEWDETVKLVEDEEFELYSCSCLEIWKMRWMFSFEMFIFTIVHLWGSVFLDPIRCYKYNTWELLIPTYESPNPGKRSVFYSIWIGTGCVRLHNLSNTSWLRLHYARCRMLKNSLLTYSLMDINMGTHAPSHEIFASSSFFTLYLWANGLDKYILDSS